MTRFESSELLYLLVLVGLFALNWWGGRWLVGRVVSGMPGRGTPDDGPGAGALVGCLERALVLLLILVGEWGVIGFVIAAKSIARFKELENKAFTDYYLAGTFTSLMVAVIVGVIALRLRTLILG